MFRVKEAIGTTGFILGVNVIAVPLDYVVLIVLREFVQRMNLVFYDLLTRARLEVLVPGSCDVVRLDVRSLKETVMDRVGPSPCIPYGENAEKE